ncbi:hypothetical protein [Microcystis phage Mel-JY01]
MGGIYYKETNGQLYAEYTGKYHRSIPINSEFDISIKIGDVSIQANEYRFIFNPAIQVIAESIFSIYNTNMNYSEADIKRIVEILIVIRIDEDYIWIEAKPAMDFGDGQIITYGGVTYITIDNRDIRSRAVFRVFQRAIELQLRDVRL